VKNKQIPVKARVALAAGNLRDANTILKKYYSICGTVIKGQQVGRVLGFPTANIKLKDRSPLFLANGVYAVKISLNKKIYDGMANIGIRPTLEQHVLTIEVNIFNFSEDLYGKVLQVFFIDRIRDEKKFSGLEELKQQISLDKIQIEAILSGRAKFDPDSI
jgi:riboflavin kinase / FMN adenylyltransferase